jgi:hypothetical protein
MQTNLLKHLDRRLLVLATVLLALSAVVTLGNLAQSTAPAAAAPLAAPTALSANASLASAPTYPVRFFTTAVITSDTRSTTFSLPTYNLVDLQYVIDQGTVNTTTLTLQYSNDGLNWVSGGNLVATNATDGTDLQQFSNFGRYTAVYADVTNSNAITITVIGLAK